MIHRFGDCELDIERRELRRAGVAVSVEPQVFELLTYLVEHPDRVVSKDELNRAVWSGRAVSDSALSSRIKSARQAIGDDGKAQSLIRTVHGSGFRFVGAVADRGAAISPQPIREQPVVAVIPFENLSGDAREDYFSEGVTTDIIATLAKHRWLAVLSRHATARFKGSTVDIAEIARETGADYVVEGSVRRGGQRVRVSVQLIDAASGNCIWSERYDRQAEDIFDIQDEITQTVSARIEPEIGYEERRKIKSTAGSRNLRAWELYHLGLAHFFKFTGPDNVKAQDFLHKAREQDPTFAEAHAWWAYAVVLGSVYWDTEPTATRLDEALAAANRALDGEPRDAVLYALKARVQLARGEYEGAIEGNRIAIELNPSFAAAYCGLADSLTYLGRCDEAVERFEKAIALSTNDPQRWAFYTYGALAHIFRGDYERAIAWADHAAAIPNRQYWTLAHKAVALALQGKASEARIAFGAALAEQPALCVSFARRKLYYVKRADQLERYLKGLTLAGASP